MRTVLFSLDFNGDGITTITDLWLLIKNCFLIPAKGVLQLVAAYPRIASFFEIDCMTGEGGGGAVFSALVWFVIFVTTVDAIQNSQMN